jgi:5-methylcytosine-specific restriction enzyme B
MTLKDTFESFFAQVDTGETKTSSYDNLYDGLIMEVGFGFGVATHIPWIAFLGPDQTVRHGIFPVFYFFKKLHYVILAYGISEEKVPVKSWRAPLKVQTIENFFRTKNKVPQKYHKSYVYAAYNTLKDLDYWQMETDLKKLIQHYKTLFTEVDL